MPSLGPCATCPPRRYNHAAGLWVRMLHSLTSAGLLPNSIQSGAAVALVPVPLPAASGCYVSDAWHVPLQPLCFPQCSTCNPALVVPAGGGLPVPAALHRHAAGLPSAQRVAHALGPGSGAHVVSCLAAAHCSLQLGQAVQACAAAVAVDTCSCQAGLSLWLLPRVPLPAQLKACPHLLWPPLQLTRRWASWRGTGLGPSGNQGSGCKRGWTASRKWR